MGADINWVVVLLTCGAGSIVWLDSSIWSICVFAITIAEHCGCIFVKLVNCIYWMRPSAVLNTESETTLKTSCCTLLAPTPLSPMPRLRHVHMLPDVAITTCQWRSYGCVDAGKWPETLRLPFHQAALPPTRRSLNLACSGRPDFAGLESDCFEGGRIRQVKVGCE